MNEHVRSTGSATASLADGLPRWRWTHADLDRMVEVGLLREADRVEPIDGEIVHVPSKGIHHERVRDELGDGLHLNTPKHYRYSNELGWRPRETAYDEPDLMIYERGLKGPDVKPEQVLAGLAID